MAKNIRYLMEHDYHGYHDHLHFYTITSMVFVIVSQKKIQVKFKKFQLE